MGSVIRGKNMAVGGEGTVDLFELISTEELDVTVAGNTQGGEDVNVGNDDWKFRYRHRPAAGHSARFPNDLWTLNAGPATGAKGVEGAAICTGIEVIWDIRNGRKIDCIVNGAAQGALTPAATVVADAVSPNPLTSKGQWCVFGNSSYQELHVDFMRLVITANNMVETADSNAATAGHITRGDGGDIGAIFQWRMSTDDSSDFPTRGETGSLQAYVDGSAKWDIDWMRIQGIQWLTDRRQKDKPAQAVVTARFTGFSGTGVGYIKDPSGVTRWPA